MGAERKHLAGFHFFLSGAARARPYRNGASHGNAARNSRCADVTEWFEVISHPLAALDGEDGFIINAVLLAFPAQLVVPL